MLNLLNMDFQTQLAKKLLQINAIKINLQNLFVWSSGIKSPIYCDNRIALSDIEARNQIIDGFVKLFEEFKNCNCIAGVATAGIPWGSILADRLAIPFIYVRSEAKDHGRGNLIEGSVNGNEKIVVIEDLISTGGSSIKVVNNLMSAGLEVLTVLSIFDYKIPISVTNFLKINCNYNSIINFDTLIKEALSINYISEVQYEQISSWKSDPENWFKNI